MHRKDWMKNPYNENWSYKQHEIRKINIKEMSKIMNII